MLRNGGRGRESAHGSKEKGEKREERGREERKRERMIKRGREKRIYALKDGVKGNGGRVEGWKIETVGRRERRGKRERERESMNVWDECWGE